MVAKLSINLEVSYIDLLIGCRIQTSDSGKVLDEIVAS